MFQFYKISKNETVSKIIICVTRISVVITPIINNLKRVREILKMNRYPVDFVENHIKIRLNNIKYLNTNNENINNQTNIFKRLPEVCLPLNKSYFFKLSNALKEYLISTIPLLKKIQMQLPNKVNGFNCEDCSACYINEAKRAF